MSYYAHLDSNESLECTNLQIYSLQKAASDWNKLIDLISDRGVDHVDHLRERLAFILSCLGLSLSQLLGQNCPSREKEKMPMPGVLLSNILREAGIDRINKLRLNKTFTSFLTYYGAVRHFGENKDEQNYRTIDQLTPRILDRFRCMTIEIWDIIIAIYKKDPENDLNDFRSISELVKFKDLVEGVQKINAETANLKGEVMERIEELEKRLVTLEKDVQQLKAALKSAVGIIASRGSSSDPIKKSLDELKRKL